MRGVFHFNKFNRNPVQELYQILVHFPRHVKLFQKAMNLELLHVVQTISNTRERKKAEVTTFSTRY